MYDRDNWVQVWVSMPGEGIQSASLFWFRIDTQSFAFPFGSQLAADAAAFFAGSIGFTNDAINGFAFVHAYLLTTVFGLVVGVHGYATFPGGPPLVVPTMPACSTVIVVPTCTPRVRQAHWSMGYTPKSWVTDGRPNVNADVWVTIAAASFPAGFASQGRHFTPVVVSYKNRDWYDITSLSLSPRLGGRHRRLQPRTNRMIGNVPKILP